MLAIGTENNVIEKQKPYFISGGLDHMFNIVLVEPEIPANTGNIARTCAVTNCKLHLVQPLGFSIYYKQIKRAGFD